MAQLGYNVPLPASVPGGVGTATPLPTQVAGNAEAVGGLGQVGVNPSSLGQLTQTSAMNPAQQAGYQSNYNTVMQADMGAVNPFMNAIRGTLGAAQGNVGAQSGTVSNQILANFLPQMMGQAAGFAGSQQGASNNAQMSAMMAAINRLLQQNPYSTGGGGGGGGTGGQPLGNLDPSNILGGLSGNATSPANAAIDAANAAKQAGANNPGLGTATGGTQQQTNNQQSQQPPTVNNFPAVGSPQAGSTNQYQYTPGGSYSDSTNYVNPDSGGLAGNLPSNYPYQIPYGTPDPFASQQQYNENPFTSGYGLPTTSQGNYADPNMFSSSYTGPTGPYTGPQYGASVGTDYGSYLGSQF